MAIDSVTVTSNDPQVDWREEDGRVQRQQRDGQKKGVSATDDPNDYDVAVEEADDAGFDSGTDDYNSILLSHGIDPDSVPLRRRPAPKEDRARTTVDIRSTRPIRKKSSAAFSAAAERKSKFPA